MRLFYNIPYKEFTKITTHKLWKQLIAHLKFNALPIIHIKLDKKTACSNAKTGAPKTVKVKLTL
jgi:hypothetical protein